MNILRIILKVNLRVFRIFKFHAAETWAFRFRLAFGFTSGQRDALLGIILQHFNDIPVPFATARARVLCRYNRVDFGNVVVG